MIGEWFNEGVEAYGREVKADACPYPVGTEQESEWLAGWMEARVDRAIRRQCRA